MQYIRRPAWRYFPQPDRPRDDMRALINGMTALGSWLEQTWWILEKGAKNTKLITQALELHLPAATSFLPSGTKTLQRGWNLETREKYPNLPFLYDEGDASVQSVQPDAIFVDDHDRLTLVEIEGGGAETNYRGMKDIVESLLLPPVD